MRMVLVSVRGATRQHNEGVEIVGESARRSQALQGLPRSTDRVAIRARVESS